MCMGLSKNICQSDTLFLCTAPTYLTAPMVIELNIVEEYIVSWDAPPGGVESYTFYYADPLGPCRNVTLDADMTSHNVTYG